MTFSEQLNNYINEFKCSSQELVLASGLSSAVISRYRNGERTPNIKSKHLENLVNGLYKISINKKTNISKEEIYNALICTLSDIDIDFEQLSQNLNKLITTLNISIADLARFIGYDSSFVSKIRNGTRTPAKPKDFIESVCNFVINKYTSEDDKKAVSLLIDCPLKDLNNTSTYHSNLLKWLSTNSAPIHNYINDFLNNLDTFDLNQYIKAIHFDKMKIPFVPFYKASSKNYYGIEEMKKGELDFFKATVLSKSTDSIFMCSDMPMEDMAEDVEFGKKWMFAIAMSLKKGLHLNIIHNIDRPFNEMMLGLESWIPIYMTGQVSPYYLKEVKNSVYHHLNYVSNACALSGECIKGSHDKGKYYLTTNNNEINYYKQKCDLLLKKAYSLMDIYTTDNKSSYDAFLSNDYKVNGDRKRFLSSLPLFTISDKLLESILIRNDINSDEIKEILKYKNNEEKNIEYILQKNIVNDNIYIETEDEFNENPAYLQLENIFIDKKISYNYDEYLEHINELKKYKNDNYKINFIENRTFKNITVTILDNNYVIISKSSNPVIHFVIRHPKLIYAISNFKPLIKE